MLTKAIDLFRKLPDKAKKILGGLVRVGFREVVQSVPIVGTASRLLEELADHGTSRLTDIGVDLADLKPAGEAYTADQLDAVDRWLGNISQTLHGVQERLEQLLAANDTSPWDKVAEEVQKALLENEDLSAEFSKVQRQLQEQTLSLHRIEQQLSTFFHEQQGVRLSLEEIKAFLLESPLVSEWKDFRRADPDGVRALREADEMILAGRREEGEKRLLELLRRRGVGTTVIARHLGLHKLARGQLDEVAAVLEAAGEGAAPPGVTGLLSVLSTHASRPTGPAWRSLPRGLIVGRKYRIEEEVGRGGMASVYRVVGVDRILRGLTFALKVPAPNFADDEAAAERFLQEIKLSLRLSELARRAPQTPPLVLMLDHVTFEDPSTGKELYGLVMEYVPGRSLARLLAERKAQRQPFTPEEIRGWMESVCTALEFAHAQSPPTLHRDVKAQNVMVTPEGKALLMDFGIARVLDDRRDSLTRTGALVGTPGIIPPELYLPGSVPDERVDVYMAGKLLVEVMTFSLLGDPEMRPDCPVAWADLIADATSQVRGKRPRTIRAFLNRVQDRSEPATAAPPAERMTVVVDRLDRGDCRTIGEALKMAAPGARILIHPGVYREGITLTRPVELAGGGPRTEIIVENDGGSALLMQTEDAVVRGITLRCTAGSKGMEFCGVDVPQGRLVLEDCDITSDTLACIAVHGPQAHPLIRNCKVHDGKHAGIYVSEQGRGTFEGCDVFGNTHAGIVVGTGGDPKVANCKVHDGKYAGIFVYEQGRGTFEGCDVLNNANVGIAVATAGDPKVANCKVHDGKDAGIFVYEQGRGTFEGCEVFGNAHAGIAVATAGNPKVANCKVHDGKDVGIHVYEQGRGTFEGCDVFGNANVGIAVKTGGDPKVAACNVHDGKSAGIYVCEQGRGTFEGCGVFGNIQPGIHVATGGDPKVATCKVQDGKSAGIYVCEQGRGTFEGCDVFGNTHAGIVVATGGDPKVANCKVHDGKDAGISVYELGRGTFEGCDVFGNAHVGIAVATGGDPTIRKCRVNRNEYQAVWVHAEGRGTVEDCDLTANKQGGWNIEAGCDVKRRNNRE